MPLVFVPLVVIAAVLVWIYADAKTQQQRGTPVVFSMGAFTVDAPETWVICCLVLFVIFVPLYLVGRRG